MTRLFSTTAWLIFFVPFLATAQAPTLVSPNNNIVTSQTSVSFEWNGAAGAVEYHIQIAENASFSPVITENTSITSTTFSVTLASGKKYFWRVRAYNGSSSSGWSSVRTFTVFSPANINVSTWYKADYGIQLDGSGKVLQWDDASGNANHAVQSNPTMRPLYVASAPEINNKPLIRFDGANDFFYFSTILTSLETVFWVIKEDADASNLYRSLLGDYNNQPDFHRGCCDGGFPGPTRYIYDDQYASSSVKNGTTRINGNVVPHLSSNVPTSISILSTKTTGNARAGTFSVDRPAQLGEYRTWDGDLAELIMFNDPLSDSLINLVTEYLRYKYAPPVNLGPDWIESYKLCNTITLALNYYKSYAWSTGATTSSIQITTPGTYSVTVTDQFNRVSTDTIEVGFVRPNMIQPASICLGDSLVWDTGLNGSYSFQWQDGSTGSTYTIREEGTYWVKVFDSTGCIYQTPSVHIAVDTFAAIADLGPDTLICVGQNIGLISGEEFAEDFLWSTGETEPEISIYLTGMYYLTVTDDYGCMAIDSIAVDVGANAPVSNFIAPHVCFGDSTSFADQTTIAQPNFVTSWFWNFGDGETDTVSHPVHRYSAPGNYTVTLTTTADNLCTNSKTKSVRVYALPQALFYDSVICVNKNHQFTDASIPASSATIMSWSWNFGDNTASFQQHPVHEYETTDTFSVSLAIIDSRGCRDTFMRPVESIPPPPAAGAPNLILPSNNVVLSNPSVLVDWQRSEGAFYYSLQIAADNSFTNLVKNIAGIVEDSVMVTGLAYGYTYYWRVLAYNMCGDYNSSAIRQFTLFEPAVLPGLCLWLSADRGITTDINDAVSDWLDNSPTDNNASQFNSLRRPLYVPGVPELAGAPVLKFDGLDDYVQFNMINTIRTVFWVVKEDANATPFYRHLLGSTSAQPDFHRGCCDDGYPGTRKYIYDNEYATSAVITSTTRVNGNVVNALQTDVPANYAIISTQTQSNSKGDCFSCDRPAQLTSDQRYWDGDLAELIIFCEPLSDSLVNLVETYLHDKYAPPVNLGPDVVLEYGFCTPTVLSAGDRFVSYEWSTGETTPTIQANGPGTYWVRAKDIFGHISYDEVNITGGLNIITFDDTLDICLGDSVVWDTQLDHSYLFEWQDGSNDSIYVIREPGQYWVTVSDSFNCSITTDTVLVRIDSFRVLATLGADTNLCAGNRIGLVAGEQVAASYTWSDGSSASSLKIFQSGNYSLTVQNINGCIAHDTVHVNIIGIAPEADFSFLSVCQNDSTRFTDQSTPPVIESWKWDFGDGNTAVIQHPVHRFDSPRTYHVKLMVTDSIGCSQDVIKTVEIYPLPASDFYHDLVNCAADNVNFYDTSVTSAAQTITNWLWTFGDGGSSEEENPVHVFQSQGIYPVSLRVTTDKGCVNTAYDTLEIFPELIAGIRVENLCFDYVTKFFDDSPGFSNVSWYWDFGDRYGYSNKKNPTYSYFNPGTYTVTLRVKNAIGCNRTVSKTITVTGRPTVDFETPALCQGEAFRFSDNTLTHGGDEVIAWQWNFGDHSPIATVENPVHVYQEAGQYAISLHVRTENGCENSKTKTITVANPPVADFTFTPDYGAAPLKVSFTNRTTGGNSYFWDFGDTFTSVEINPVHTYQQNQTVDIQLIAFTLSGCSDTAVKSLSIALATLDIAIDKIIIERNYNDDCSYYVKMGAYILNIGTRNVTTFDILASSTDGGTIAEHWQGEFENRQLTYQFNADFLIHDCEADEVICMEVMNPNGEEDYNTLNNRSCIPLSSEAVIIGPYPNPAGDIVNFDVVLPKAGSLKVSNYNAVGKKLDFSAVQKEKGYHRVSLDTHAFSPGVYMLKVEFDGEVRILKYLVR
ncbi:MAG TPA: PKD domain-containing protein [Chitinophagales bacterium]|nr:PKD domain-containing protein [Chitinophagales bacterium]